MDVRAFHFACIRLLRDLSFIVTVLVQSHHIVLALSAMTQAGTYHGGYWCAMPSAEWYLFSWLIRVRGLCYVLLVLGTCFEGRLSAVVCQQVRRLLSSISLHISFPASKTSPDQPSRNWGVGTSDLRNVPGHRRGPNVGRIRECSVAYASVRFIRVRGDVFAGRRRPQRLLVHFCTPFVALRRHGLCRGVESDPVGC